MLRQRVLTALVLGPLIIWVILAAPAAAAIAVLTILVLAGAWEWSAFPRWKALLARIAYVAAIAAVLWWAWRLGVDDRALDWWLYAALIWWAAALLWILVAPLAVSRIGAAVAGVFVLAPTWLALARLHAHEPQMLLFVLLLVVAADIGAYFAGRRFGSHKLAPQVSPGKTWEGVAGGLAGAGVLALAGVWWFDTPALTFLLLCLAVIAMSVLGDLAESLFKRHAGLKDSGTLLPGHGGVLDRVDSVTAAAPVFLLGLERLGLLR